MKRFFLALSFLALPSLGHAFGNQLPSLEYQVSVSSVVGYLVTVATSSVGKGFGATQMDSPQLVGRVAVEVQNLDTTANLWCLVDSTYTVNGSPTTNSGRKISPGASWVVSIRDQVNNPPGPAGRLSTTERFWCLTDATATTKAWVTQLY